MKLWAVGKVNSQASAVEEAPAATDQEETVTDAVYGPLLPPRKKKCTLESTRGSLIHMRNC
ncbi:MAG: hypothetical protein APF77_02370 [Clostridia bacterium BRH_c25]|nr:MAG: hypothetical protein APF77_02370 [Clostridia bacterium BRH_c25]